MLSIGDEALSGYHVIYILTRAYCIMGYIQSRNFRRITTN